ncbi:MAG: NAD-dependent deacylase [Bryobacterales bacterium]|nr:NAD-dependent deacylase [Bryobacterales bacterium]MBV9399420.1 NAD-dependent deacylase [Bryobacterales bacterium]
MRHANVRDLLASASRIAVLTGAGISAESGIPTFRGAGGLWRSFKAEDLATPGAFARDPKLVWEWYDWRRGQIASAQPNAAHRALVELEVGQVANLRRVANPPAEDSTSPDQQRFTLITQNVDGLHNRAGSRNLLKLHGDIWIQRCTACGAERNETHTPLPEIPPRCSCGGLERPGVVWFGENLPEEILARAQYAATQAEVFLVIGTSALVYPAAGLAGMAKSAGAKVVEINVAETPVTNWVDYSLRGAAAEILPQILP